MAQGRILRKAISRSEKINLLDDKTTLFYTWLIPFQDDFGLVWESANKIKWEIFPAREDFTITYIQEVIATLFKKGVLKIVELEGKNWIWFSDFQEKQTLKKDRMPSTYLDQKYKWDFFEKIQAHQLKEYNGFHLETNVFQVEKQVKISKVNLKEKDEAKASPTFVSLIQQRFTESYKKKFGKEPAIDFGKDGSIVKKAEKLFDSPEEAYKLIDYFLGSDKAKDCGYTLSVCFSSHTINNWHAQRNSNQLTVNNPQWNQTTEKTE